NLTATNTTAASFFTVYPTGQPRPLASNLNWTAHQTIPNLAEVGLGGGQISIFNAAGAADAVVDLEGYFAPPSGGTAGEFAPLSPARVTDTRTGSGQANAGAHLHSGTVLNVQITGAGGVPLTGVDAVVLNATVTNTTTPSFLTVYPTGASRPLASNLNWIGGQTVPNRVVVKVGTGGQVSFYNLAGNTDVVVDVNGYITDSTASGVAHFSLSPSRILDTRNGTGGFSSPIGPNGTISVNVAGQGGVPASGAEAVAINVTVTSTTPARVLTRAIDSVLGQTFRGLRLSIYDDASNDETEGVVGAYAARDARVTYHRHPSNIGLVHNFAFGLEGVTTPYFSFLSEDDWLLPDFYSIGVEGLESQPHAAFVSTRVIHVDDELSVVQQADITAGRAGLHMPPQGLLTMLERGAPTWTGTLFRTSAA